MAGRGPAPKDPAKRRRRNATDPETVIVNDGELRGPELPEGVLPGDEEWHPMTVQWWHTWRVSPMAATFLDTDWAFLLDAALMHHTAWTKGKWEFLGPRCGQLEASAADEVRGTGEPAARPRRPERGPQGHQRSAPLGVVKTRHIKATNACDARHIALPVNWR